ncbi:MAG: ShlB/FhaC/HecB family hemolysin secretion/activation protein [Gallionella sp.]|nr:ShlB/FhaC/HecB family hemolysin secretion/activation protein [Gallionella sp.]
MSRGVLLGWLLLFSLPSVAQEAASNAVSPEADDAAVMLRFDISSYTVDGAKLLSKAEIDAAVAPFVGKNKDFSDVQRALEAVEELYVARGYSAVHILLPEQELEKGNVHFQAVESSFGKVVVKHNEFVTEANVLNALPSVRVGAVPRSKQIARELKVANENPARQLNVVLKAGEKEGEVDAQVIVVDSKPTAWGVSLNNSGSPETGRSRLGVSFRHANLFDKDHVMNLQFQTSPEHTDRVTVLGGSYHVPLYQSGNSLDFFGGYSNVNSVVGGLNNFQGGGLIFSARYNYALERFGVFDPKLSFGLDWRDFRRIEMTTPLVTTLYNEVVVMPLSVAYAAQGKYAESDLAFNVSLAANIPGMSKGRGADFAAYDVLNGTQPNSSYKVVRYGASYSTLVAGDWQFRTALNGQFSNDVLIQGEQMRLGGADGVRGFSEGSEGGESAARVNVEGYSPDWGKGELRFRGLAFFDAGEARVTNGGSSFISSAGLGLRAGYGEKFSVRLDAGRIINDGNDVTQKVGDWRAHLELSAMF